MSVIKIMSCQLKILKSDTWLKFNPQRSQTSHDIKIFTNLNRHKRKFSIKC